VITKKIVGNLHFLSIFWAKYEITLFIAYERTLAYKGDFAFILAGVNLYSLTLVTLHLRRLADFSYSSLLTNKCQRWQHTLLCPHFMFFYNPSSL